MPDDQRYPTGQAATALLARWAVALDGARSARTLSPNQGGGPGQSLDGRGGTDPGWPDPEPYGQDLLARYAEPHRHYHTTAHLTAVLDHVDALVHHAADPDTVRLAAWYHDAVYQPERSTNEERSARLATRALTEAGVPAERTAEAARLIRLTADHAPDPDDANGEVLCDADLAVLADPPRGYAAYASAIRQEYGFLPDEVFREGRSAVLHNLLGRARLYRTPEASRRWERTARHNIATELELLAG